MHLHAFSYTSIRSISIPKEVRVINDYCFFHCHQLTTVNIPTDSQLESINTQSFSYTAIETIYIPEKVTFFHGNVIEGVANLKSITCHPLNKNYLSDNGILYSKNQATIARYPNSGSISFTLPNFVTVIGSHSFISSNIESIELHDKITRIEDYAFSTTKLKDILIPDSVTFINKGAFRWCSYLTSVKLPSNITSINLETFKECPISEIIIPEGVTTIAKQSFEDCSQLKNVQLPSTIKKLEGGAFPKTVKLNFAPGAQLSLDDQMIMYDLYKNTVIQIMTDNESVTLPSNVTTISSFAFANSKLLTTVNFESNNKLTIIMANAFKGCISLSTITLPTSLTRIETYAFQNCYSLKTITFGSSLNYIGKSAFDSCTSLTTITFSNGVSLSINEYSFGNCKVLNSITFGSGLSSLGFNCFENCLKLEQLIFPASLNSIGMNCFFNTGVKNVIFPEDSIFYDISPSSFRGCTQLANIQLPANVRSLGDNCFESTKLSIFSVPSSVVTISSYSFRNCYDLSGFIIPEDNKLETIKDRSFEGCTSLRLFRCELSNFFTVFNGALFNKNMSTLICFPPASSIKYFSFPDEVRLIGSGAFIGCRNILSILIPDNSIERIGTFAFANCTSLKMINIPSSLSVIENGAFSGCVSLKCGIFIDNKERRFIEELIETSLLPISALNECGLFSCKVRNNFNLPISPSYLYVFILM